MILLPSGLSAVDVALRLGSFTIDNDEVLAGHLGFASDAAAAGSRRQTFSIVVSPEWVAAVRSQVTVIYDQLVAACWPAGAPLPFDMIRLDAYITEVGDMKVLEINTRSVGIHEFAEWIDDQVGALFSVPKTYSLNGHFVSNQKLLQEAVTGPNPDLLYLTGRQIPEWIYMDKLREQYPSVDHATDVSELIRTEEGIVYRGKNYRAITRKFSRGAMELCVALDAQDVVRVMQPFWMQDFGKKNYLPNFDSPTIPRTRPFEVADIPDYEIHQSDYVLKIIDGGSSSDVHLGAAVSEQDWALVIGRARLKPAKWVVQDYVDTTSYAILPHGLPAQSARLQFGIFLLPQHHDPRSFDMDISIKGYVGSNPYITFDPSSHMPDIWFGSVLISQA
ncbi:MAG: hypothetical protein ABIV43_00505 [Candidatus Saccharimonadales bacterium]